MLCLNSKFFAMVWKTIDVCPVPNYSSKYWCLRYEQFDIPSTFMCLLIPGLPDNLYTVKVLYMVRENSVVSVLITIHKYDQKVVNHGFTKFRDWLFIYLFIFSHSFLSLYLSFQSACLVSRKSWGKQWSYFWVALWLIWSIFC